MKAVTTSGRVKLSNRHLSNIYVPPEWHGAPRDVRLAWAILLMTSSRAALDNTDPLRLSFTIDNHDIESMTELCELAGWKAGLRHQQAALSAIAARLAEFKYLSRIPYRRNEMASERNEPLRWFIYTMPEKYRVRLNPKDWPEIPYTADWLPAQEWKTLLRHVFHYEGPVPVRADE